MAGTAPANLPPDVNLGPMVLGLLWGTTTLATIVVGLRAYVRLITRAQGWDDYFAYIAAINVIFGAIVNSQQVHYGFGRHLVYVQPTVQEVSKWTIIAEIQSYSAVMLVKLSVCCFLLRVIKLTHKKVLIFIYILMVFLTGVGIAAMLVDAFQCFPLAKAWNKDLSGKCINPQVLTRLTEVFGAIGCATDFACVVIPIFIFRSLQINKRTKIALYIILLLGLITAACAIGKSVTSSFQSADLTYDFVPVEIWAGFEGNFGLTVACIPALRPLFARLLQGTSKGSKTSDSDTSMRLSNPFASLISRNRTRAYQSREAEAEAEAESDGRKFVPLTDITISTTLEVDTESRESIDKEMMHPYDMDRGPGMTV
ncbi:MAG: hypothetical protein M1827_004631 [Pycnora praestabilis]|nr:MAG: hypothetical protein M1827_004631 [Pycnora praestabilis]